jgi:hypothetical protein
MPVWQFLDYITEERTCPIVDWYGTLGAEQQAAFDVLVDTLAEKEDWDELKESKRKYKLLTRRHLGLCELKFKVGGRKFRPIGILHAEIREFIFLGGCEKKGFFGTTDPPNAFDAALRLKEAYDRERGATRAHV